MLGHVLPTLRRAPDAGTVPRPAHRIENERATCASDEPSTDLPSLALHDVDAILYYLQKNAPGIERTPIVGLHKELPVPPALETAFEFLWVTVTSALISTALWRCWIVW